MVAAVVLVGAVAVLNLLLTVGVIRRLRDHARALSHLTAPPAMAAIGQEVGAFTATTVDGASLDRDRIAGETLVGFFSPGCERCRLQLPGFVAHARSVPGGRDRVLAAVVGDGEEALELVAALQPVAQVVTEHHGGPLGTAFQVRAYPTVLTVAPDRGRVVVVDEQVALGVHAAL